MDHYQEHHEYVHVILMRDPFDDKNTHGSSTSHDYWVQSQDRLYLQHFVSFDSEEDLMEGWLAPWHSGIALDSIGGVYGHNTMG